MFGYINNNEIIISNPLTVNDIVYQDSHLRGMDATDREALSIYPVREETYIEETHRCTGYAYALVDGEILGVPSLVEIPAEELTRLADSKARADAKAKLASLDLIIPRGLEDLMTSLKVDVTTLPPIQLERLAAKEACREVIRNTSYLETK